MDPQHHCWYQRELMFWWQARLDKPFTGFNADNDLDPEFKEFFCKRKNPAKLKTYKPQLECDPSLPDITYQVTPTPQAKILLEYTYWYGRQLHQRSPGYLSNERQQRMAGLATLEVAQVLYRYWYRGIDDVSGPSSSGHKALDHKFGWRDIYDIIVRWRQISEPNDPVWWVDLLTKEQFSEGFGSHTPMVTGHCHVIRYSPMVELSFPILKRELVTQKNFSEKMKRQVQQAKDIYQLFHVMHQDFWVTTPCLSIRTGMIMEGTRLTLQCTDRKAGLFEYSIRTPGTPPRWTDYDEEMNYVFNEVTTAIRDSNSDLDIVSDLILTLTFYWYNFMPLSRGTAACGYIGMLAMFLAVGIKIDTMVPEKVLVDWEAILRPNPLEFIEQIKPWMYPARVLIDRSEFLSLPDMSRECNTIRTMTEFLNFELSHVPVEDH
eukprot:TRINITY_DN7132_c0_g1_i2.p1 TRINITY_DN7132_c0_g1~~TRINITY_DN7132_c0_g1_i2.p1  ORF type:complete len:433 (+),score=77.31 TRINITY_DN7132_c0_g1_i2:2000-3298(+)